MTLEKQAAESESDEKNVTVRDGPAATGSLTGGALTGGRVGEKALALQKLIGNRAVSRLAKPPAEGSRARTGVGPGADLAGLRLARQATETHVDKWAGTLVDYIVINSVSGRAVFHTASGDEIRGTIATDLQPGTYSVKADRAHADTAHGETMRWVFDTGQTRPGARFLVELEGALPETLVYPETVPVTVTLGLDSTSLQKLVKKLHALVGTRDTSPQASAPADVSQLVASGFTGGHPYDQDFREGCSLLQALTRVDLVEVLTASTDDVRQNLLINFDKARADNLVDDDLLVVLDRLEWKEAAPQKLYVDNFTSFGVDQQSFARDPEREKKGLWNIQIIFYYGNLTPDRAIKLYYDDILDVDVSAPAFNKVGMWGLVYPAALTKATVPRMWDAKKKVRDQIETGNFDFIWTAYSATQMMFDAVMIGSGMLMATIPAATTGGVRSGYRGPFGTGGRKPQEIYDYVNRNPKALSDNGGREYTLGEKLDRLAQTRHLGDDVARVYGAPESNVRGVRSGDYRFVKVDGTEIRADAYHPENANMNKIYDTIMQKSGTQADVVVVELKEGTSTNVSVADAKATADSAISASRESELGLKRVIFVKNGQIIVDVIK